ncbi:MAG: hypothetical protein SVK08_01380 [Halobacteriota archaeon]|nr:hypothetical protein [Halobacteriota archaeon]
MAKGIVWTPEKEQFVEQNYLLMSDWQIADCLRCAESTVNKKVNDLGLIRPSHYKSPYLPLFHLFSKWDMTKYEEIPDPETPLYKKIKKKISKNKLKLRTDFSKLAN